jgi:DNA-binding transcriptional ArsR family regulator
VGIEEEPVPDQATRGSDHGRQFDCGAAVAPPSEKLREFLKGLASEQRQQMLELFAGGVELTVGTVAERLGVGQSNASQQLAILKRGGLLASRREGKQVLYRVDTSSVERSLDELRDYLRTCCPPLDQAQDHA